MRGIMNVRSGAMINIANGGTILMGIKNTSVNGTNPGIYVSPGDSNFISLNGNGDRKKVYLTGSFRLGSWYVIMSYQSQGFDVFPPSGEYIYRNGNAYRAVTSSGQDSVLIVKVNDGDWLACQMPVNWLGTWNP